MKYSVILLLGFSTLLHSANLEERIKSMQIQYEANKQREELLQKLKQEGELINAYIEIVTARRKCKELGIDCDKGEGIDNTQTKLRSIEEEKQLINAYLSLRNEKQKCINAGIDCKTGLELPKTVVKKVPTIKPNDKLPALPTVMGYVDDKVLLRTNSGQIKLFAQGDTLISGYTIQTINTNKQVELSYKGKIFPIE